MVLWTGSNMLRQCALRVNRGVIGAFTQHDIDLGQLTAC